MPKKKSPPLTREDLKLIQEVKKKLKVTFRDRTLLLSSLTHPSYKYENQLLHLDDFDRLEFFGDTILNYIISRELYRLFPAEKEGMLSRLRGILVSRKILSRIAKPLGFLKWIRLGRGLKEQAEFSKDKVMADAFESFIAALYFDRGLKAVEKFLLREFKGYFDIRKLFRIDPNPKSTLQELCQKKWQKIPTYETTVVEGGVKTVVTISPRNKASALGKNRKESEEKAARMLLKKVR